MIGNTVECRTALPAAVSKGMPVAARFDLKDVRALSLQRGCAAQELRRAPPAHGSIGIGSPGGANENTGINFF